MANPPTKSPFLNLVYFNRYHHAGYRSTANATGYNEHSWNFVDGETV